jgi:hypothetical protein
VPGQIVDRSWRREKTSFAVAHGLARTVNVGSDDRQPGRHRLREGLG